MRVCQGVWRRRPSVPPATLAMRHRVGVRVGPPFAGRRHGSRSRIASCGTRPAPPPPRFRGGCVQGGRAVEGGEGRIVKGWFGSEDRRLFRALNFGIAVIRKGLGEEELYKEEGMAEVASGARPGNMPPTPRSPVEWNLRFGSVLLGTGDPCRSHATAIRPCLLSSLIQPLLLLFHRNSSLSRCHTSALSNVCWVCRSDRDKRGRAGIINAAGLRKKAACRARRPRVPSATLACKVIPFIPSLSCQN